MIIIRDHIPCDLQAVRVYVLADYRTKNLRRLIDRQRTLCSDRGYDLEWIGYSSEGVFDSAVYDEFIKDMDLTVFGSSIIIGLTEVGTDGIESKEPHLISADNGYIARKVLGIAQSVKDSTEKDPKKRFSKLRMIEAADLITDILPGIRCLKA